MNCIDCDFARIEKGECATWNSPGCADRIDGCHNSGAWDWIEKMEMELTNDQIFDGKLAENCLWYIEKEKYYDC